MKTAYYLFKSLRPKQWVKNGFILIPLLFARKVFHYPSLLKSMEAVVIFCLVASAIYLINDLFDLKADRRHPLKKHRPLAAGLISSRLAKVTAAVLLIFCLFLGCLLRARVFSGSCKLPNNSTTL